MAWGLRIAPALLALVLASTVGCSLARNAIGGTGNPGLDAGMVDVGGGGHDGGPPAPDTGHGCTTSSCDDGNACTDDACDPSGTCSHTNNTAICDDGLFCNGMDTCGGGTCSVHPGTPCAGSSQCDEMTDTCTGCAITSDCPAPMQGPWSACDFGGSLCGISGTQTRTVTSYTCGSGGVCMPTATQDSQMCTRTTDGQMCAAPMYSDWSACTFADACTLNGVQTRSETTSYCMGGSCTMTSTDETQMCTRASTDGTACGTPMTGAWSACMVDAACGTTGTQTRTNTTPTCMGGTCNQHSAMDTQSCTVAMGGACGATTCSPWGACTQTAPGTCDRTGTQTRMCTTPTCVPGGGSGGSGTCTGSTPTTESQACSANVANAACMVTTCGQCSTGLLSGCPHGQMGMQRCSTSTGSCMDFGTGPFCLDTSPSYSSRSCTCP